MAVDGQLVDKGKRFSLRLPVSFDHPECHKGYYGRFRRSGAAGDFFFFAVHTAPSVLRLPAEPNLHLWSGDRLADIVSESGLFDWLLERTR